MWSPRLIIYDNELIMIELRFQYCIQDVYQMRCVNMNWEIEDEKEKVVPNHACLNILMNLLRLQNKHV